MSTSQLSTAILFPLGVVVATPGARGIIAKQAVNASLLLQRHQSGDWGSIPEEDAAENNASVATGNRILSIYPVGNDRIWIITEADRRRTTLLLPSEY